VGTINAYHARLAERSGYKSSISRAEESQRARSGSGPGHQQSRDVLTDVPHHGRVHASLLVDTDTGFGASAFNIARTVKSLDQIGRGGDAHRGPGRRKRCGHRPGKELVPKEEMVDRIKAAVDAKTDADFVVMARTDALAVEGLTCDRSALACVDAGADAVFPEAYLSFPCTASSPMR